MSDAALEQLPIGMHQAWVYLPPSMPLTLLTRHSIREQANGQGFASYDLPLTPSGRELAQAWGQHLHEKTGRVISTCLSSPIGRCVDTAEQMLTRLPHPRPLIQTTPLLVEPGSFVQDVIQAGPLFIKHGPLEFINAFLRRHIPGMKVPHHGAQDILRLLHAHQPVRQDELLLAVSHDTILAALLAVLAGHAHITWEDWPEMMEGVFLWFDDQPFEKSVVNWVWRGQHHQHSIADLLARV